MQSSWWGECRVGRVRGGCARRGHVLMTPISMRSSREKVGMPSVSGARASFRESLQQQGKQTCTVHYKLNYVQLGVARNQPPSRSRPR
jgi:hypothetical protein